MPRNPPSLQQEPKPKRFAILYADGSIREGGGPKDEWVDVTIRVSRDWMDAPCDGVQAVIQENPYSSRYVWRNTDFYYWVPDGEVCSADDIGPYMRAYTKFIKHGLCVTQDEYEKVMQRADAYKTIPKDGDRRPWPDADIS